MTTFYDPPDNYQWCDEAHVERLKLLARIVNETSYHAAATEMRERLLKYLIDGVFDKEYEDYPPTVPDVLVTAFVIQEALVASSRFDQIVAYAKAHNHMDFEDAVAELVDKGLDGEAR